MTDRRLAAAALLVTVVILVAYTMWSVGSGDDAATTTPDPAAVPAGDPDDNRLTRAAVAEHDTRDDCWTVIDDEVYDLTDYIGSHPGGAVIVEACGDDATTLFEDRRREAGERVGSGEEHSDDAEDVLDELQIGVVED